MVIPKTTEPLPLSAIKARSLEEKDLDDCYGFVNIASNLVSADKKYKDIIENLLGKTVVCEDMDSAIAIAKKYKNRFKIVTLDGQVINPGGSLTGGSLVKNAGLLSRSSDIEKMEEGDKEARRLLIERNLICILIDVIILVIGSMVC